MHPLTPDFGNTPVSSQRPPFDYEPAEQAVVPSVSVIVPYYNTGAIFAETVQSVQLQSLQSWEMVIVNDGSDDPQALQVLDGYRNADSRIRVIDLETNKGLPGARNAGVWAARGEYLFFLDSDDLIEPTALEKMAWCLDSYPEYAFCKGFTVCWRWSKPSNVLLDKMSPMRSLNVAQVICLLLMRIPRKRIMNSSGKPPAPWTRCAQTPGAGSPKTRKVLKIRQLQDDGRFRKYPSP